MRNSIPESYRACPSRRFLPSCSDGPARLPVLLAGEPRRLLFAHAAAGAPAPAGNRRNENCSSTQTR